MKYFLLLGGLIGLFSCSDKRETTTPIRKELVEAVYSSVTIEPIDVYKVNASISGYLDEIKVKEGDFVNVGDVIFSISNKPIQLNQQNAQLTYELLKDSYSGEANLIEEMRLDLQSAKLKMQNDSLCFFRIIKIMINQFE